MSAFGRVSSCIALAFAATVGGFFYARTFPSQTLQLTFLSVGQGDSTVWQDGATTVLVDVGPKTREGFDAGARMVIPKLRKMGIGNVSLILLTHPDSDHVGGLKAIHARFPTAKIVTSAEFRDHPDMLRCLKDAGVEAAQVIWIGKRTLVRLERSTLDLAAPPIGSGENANDGSLFTRITSGSVSAVLTGDASDFVERRMQPVLQWQAQILKAGHHGSRTSTSETFLQSVKPILCVISCGRDNRFGHPHKSVLECLKRNGVQAVRTDLEGDVSFKVESDSFVRIRP